MNNDSYKHLITEVACLIGLAVQADKIHASGNLIFKNVAVTVFFNEKKSDLVHVYVDFGDFPQHKAQDIFRRLLEINLLVSSQGSPRLGLDPTTGRVIFCWSRPLADLSAQKLLGGIDMAVTQALSWRDNFYLDDAQAPRDDMRHALHV